MQDPSHPSTSNWATFRDTATSGLTLMQAHFSDHAFERHSHPTYAIGLTQSGIQTFHSQGTRHASLAGDLILFNPGEPHDGSPGSAEGFGYTIVYFEPALLSLWLDAEAGVRAASYFSTPVVRDRASWRLMQRALDAHRQRQESLRVDELTSLAVRTVFCKHGERSGSLAECIDPGFARMARVRDYIDAHFSENITVDALAMLAGLTRLHVTRAFIRTYRTPPHVYLNMVRLDFARRAMLRSMPLAEVALAAGFADQSHFSRRFKGSVGVPPGVWLKQMLSR